MLKLEWLKKTAGCGYCRGLWLCLLSVVVRTCWSKFPAHFARPSPYRKNTADRWREFFLSSRSPFGFARCSDRFTRYVSLLNSFWMMHTYLYSKNRINPSIAFAFWRQHIILHCSNLHCTGIINICLGTQSLIPLLADTGSDWESYLSSKSSVDPVFEAMSDSHVSFLYNVICPLHVSNDGASERTNIWISFF